MSPNSLHFSPKSIDGGDDKTVLISVAVCTYNRAEMLRQTLNSLFSQTTDLKLRYEIIVIDDGSFDETPLVLEAMAPESPVPFRSAREEGCGVAVARSRAVDLARGEWIAFIDDDEIASSHWLQTLWKFAEQKGALCVGGAVRLRLSSTVLNNLSEACRRMLGESYGRNRPELCNEKTIPGAGNLLVKKELFARFGGFDPHLAQAGEDTHFINRLRRGGIPIWFTPDAYIEHLVPAYRLEENYFRWASQRVGWSFAQRDRFFYGAGKLWLRFLARAAKAAFYHVPLWAVAKLRMDERGQMERKCHVWRLQGYRMFVNRLMTSQPTYVENKLNFRNERTRFKMQQEKKTGQ